MTNLRSRILCTAVVAGGAALLAATPASATVLAEHDVQKVQNVAPTKVITSSALTGAGALTGGLGMVPGALGVVPGAVGGLGMLP
jgi:hypothetical protein